MTNAKAMDGKPLRVDEAWQAYSPAMPLMSEQFLSLGANSGNLHRVRTTRSTTACAVSLCWVR
ncbi:MAG: hypothetical protein HZB27_04305 [Meiothermus silvanus]|nr:hypothetical protein [Allomeiothermus silvanus]